MFRSQLIWIYTVCQCRVDPGSAGQVLINVPYGIVCHTNSKNKFLAFFTENKPYFLSKKKKKTTKFCLLQL